MVTDLVDLARFETGQLKLEPASCDIMDSCRNGLEMARGQAKSKNVTIESEMVPPSVTAIADARRLRQLTSSLASAAVVSAPAGGRVNFLVEAQASGGRLRLQIQTSRRPSQISPADNSAPEAPVSAAALLRLRKMSSVAVTMVEKIVELHHGTLEVADCGSSGFAITVELPLALPAGAPHSGSATGPGKADAAKEERAPFILLADDEEIIRTITKDYLESTGYRVACVTNGREALDFLQRETPDLLIMDMQMPVLDGMDALVQLRRSSDPRIAKTPVISLSGIATPGHRERCLAAGANGCLAKPFGIKDLERVIKENLGDRV
jgi:CheY-like chemotaxis protein